MLNLLIPIFGLAFGMFLAMAAAETLITLAHPKWHYSIRGLFFAMALVSLALLVVVGMIRT